MAGKKPKEKKLTVTSPEKTKKKGKEKKPTLSSGNTESAEKLSVKPLEKQKVKRKSPKKQDAACSAPPEPATVPVTETVPEPKPQRPYRPVRVMFVCTGNTCRSAMAQVIFENYLLSVGRRDDFIVSGAGLTAFEGADMSEGAKAALAEMGMTNFVHSAHRLTRADVEYADLVVCMTEAHRRAIGDMDKVTTLAAISGGGDVPDPYGGTLDDYRRVVAYLEYACPDVLDAALKRV